MKVKENKMKVKIKSWERMVEEFGHKFEDDDYIDTPRWCWHTQLEDEIPEDRIIDIEISNRDYFYKNYGISGGVIEEYLTDEAGINLTNPLHPANSELLPELKSEQEFKLKPFLSLHKIPARLRYKHLNKIYSCF